MCGVLKILMYRSKTREVKCSKCKRNSWIYSGICTQGRIHGIGWPRNAQHFMQWISNVRKWFAKRPCNKLGSVQFLLIERTHCMTDSGFPIAGVSRVSINYCKCIQGGFVYPSVSSESRHRRPNCPKSEDNWSRLIFTPLGALLLLSATFSQSWSSWTDGDYVTVMPWRAFGPIWKVYSTHWGVTVLPNSFIIIIVIVIIIVKHFLFIRILSLLSSSSWSVGAPVLSATHYRLPWFGNLRFPENPDFLVYLNLNLCSHLIYGFVSSSQF